MTEQPRPEVLGPEQEDRGSGAIAPSRAALSFAALPRPLRFVFLNPEGLRAGWRLLLFLGIVFDAAVLLFPLVGRIQYLSLFWFRITLSDGVGFSALLVAAAVMARLERRSLAHYALRFRGAFGWNFWKGILWGFAALTVLILTLWLARAFVFGTLALHGIDIARYAAAWAIAFLMVGFFEEFLTRGYALFTLTTGIGFWPSAILLSCIFGATHLGNRGESWAGILSAGMIGLFFCLTLRRTGDLWFAIGFHAMWDFAQSFIYSVPDSGTMVPGHLLNSSFDGPRWLTGGLVGPEGSALIFPLIAAVAVLFHKTHGQVRFPINRLESPPAQP